MTKFTIGELGGYAWQCAIMNVAEVLDKDKKNALKNEWFEIEAICAKLHVRFDCNGNIIK